MPRRTEPNAHTQKMGARLRALRQERRITLSALANNAELSKGHVSSIEQGFAAITTKTITRLAKGLDLQPFYLLVSLGEDDEREKVAELIRQLSAQEIVKLRRELLKMVREAAKATAKASRARK